MAAGEWNGVGANGVVVAAGLTTSGGNALIAGGAGGSWVSKTLPANYSRLIGGIRISPSAISTDVSRLVQFTDVATPQCSIRIEINGTFTLAAGNYTGSAIATSTTSITQNSNHFLEWDITFGSSSAYHLYLDGVSILSGTGATKQTSNSYANVFVVGNNAGSSAGSTTFDDLYLFDTSTSFNNTVLNTNPVIITQFPTSDTQTQFTNVANILGNYYSATTNAGTINSNSINLRKYTAPAGCTINSVSLVPLTTSGTAKFKGVLYADSTGAPGSRLSTGTEVVGCTSGATLTLPLSTPTALTGAVSYWVGWITDTSINLQITDSVSSNGFAASNTYTSGAPSSAPAMTGSLASFTVWGNCTGATTNWESVANNPAPGDIGSISASTVSDEDLYGFPSLAAGITSVYTVAVKGNIKKSDTGSRTISLRVNSSATDSGGTLTGQAPATTYGWMTSLFDVDPHTSTTWGISAVNAATSGIKIDS